MNYLPGRLSNKDVVIFDNNNRDENRRLCGTLPDMSSTSVITMSCTPPLLGQGVEIGEEGEHYMCLVEVEVYEFNG